MQQQPRPHDPELDAIIALLKQGDLSAMQRVTPENIIPLLSRAEGDDKLVGLLRGKL
jgi:hypothetical protein